MNIIWTAKQISQALNVIFKSQDNFGKVHFNSQNITEGDIFIALEGGARDGHDFIYDAFNKGMIVSKGEFIGFINSDDIYKKDALSIISNYIRKNKATDFIFGSVKKHWGILHGYKPHKIKYSWGFYSSHSTGFFIKRKAAEKVGFYNIKYKYGLTGDEMKKYGNNLPLVMKIKMSLDELKKVDIELMTNILAEYII